MEIKDELKEMLVNNAASWGKKEGDDMAEIYVDDFLNELLSKFKLLPIHDVSQQRELLKSFFVAIDEVNRDGSVVTDENAFIDEVIKDFNCG